MQILKTGVLYFTLVFGAGFVLGPIRILWVVPRFGERMAELMETPIMFVVTLVAARWIVRRLALPPRVSSRLGMGSLALALLLVAEFTLVLWLRGLSIQEYFATRDPVSGTVYYAMLGVFAIMPLLVARRGVCPFALGAFRVPVSGSAQNDRSADFSGCGFSERINCFNMPHPSTSRARHMKFRQPLKRIPEYLKHSWIRYPLANAQDDSCYFHRGFKTLFPEDAILCKSSDTS
jgi:hypothetical protein